MRWTVVIPAKAFPGAKTRLVPASTDPDAHRKLVEAIREDTLAAARACAAVARVLVVADRPGIPDSMVQTGQGLNSALREAAAEAAQRWPADGVAALVGDLPALRPEALADALTAAAGHPHCFVPDADGFGTTMLTALPGTALDPAFGPDSAARHAATATPLEAAPGVRYDVDTADDLLAAFELGLGPATAAVLRAEREIARSP